MKYAKISNQVRQAFIQTVDEKQSTIRKAAKKYGIKFSTAKAILSIYRHEGRIGKKRRRVKKMSNEPIQPIETQKLLKEVVPEKQEELKPETPFQKEENNSQTPQYPLPQNNDWTYLQQIWTMNYINYQLYYSNFYRFSNYQQYN